MFRCIYRLSFNIVAEKTFAGCFNKNVCMYDVTKTSVLVERAGKV